MQPDLIRLAQPEPPIINGHAILTCTKYRLDIEVINGKRMATGELAYVMPARGPEIDVAALCRGPFQFIARAGAVEYALADCAAGQPFRCDASEVTGESVAVCQKTGLVDFAIKFRSEEVSLLESVE